VPPDADTCRSRHTLCIRFSAERAANVIDLEQRRERKGEGAGKETKKGRGGGNEGKKKGREGKRGSRKRILAMPILVCFWRHC